MAFSFIREGDTTSHGGRVLSCTSTNTVQGKAVALQGDMVSCPKCGGVFPIVDVKNLGMTFGARSVASEGDKTACGATLIASQGVATASPTSGGSLGNGKSVLSQTSADTSYRGRFQLLDDASRQPLAGHPYTVRATDGRIIQGTTDTSGYTDWVESDQGASLTFSQPGSAS
jgi:uncharacterized Zn-binding protein involved in type VI secretion